MEILQGNTMENSGKRNPKMGFKSPPAQQETCHVLLDFGSVLRREFAKMPVQGFRVVRLAAFFAMQLR